MLAGRAGRAGRDMNVGFGQAARQPRCGGARLQRAHWLDEGWQFLEIADVHGDRGSSSALRARARMRPMIPARLQVSHLRDRPLADMLEARG